MLLKVTLLYRNREWKVHLLIWFVFFVAILCSSIKKLVKKLRHQNWGKLRNIWASKFRFLKKHQASKIFLVSYKKYWVYFMPLLFENSSQCGMFMSLQLPLLFPLVVVEVLSLLIHHCMVCAHLQFRLAWSQ